MNSYPLRQWLLIKVNRHNSRMSKNSPLNVLYYILGCQLVILKKSGEYFLELNQKSGVSDFPEGRVAVFEDVDCAELEPGDALAVAQVAVERAQHFEHYLTLMII